MPSNSQYIINNINNTHKELNKSYGIIFLFIIAISLIIYKFNKTVETFVNNKIKNVKKNIKNNVKLFV
tara:strand:- start:156 stop:359 length:204 start_codon:yes stop_codon:yes gene_type:complete